MSEQLRLDAIITVVDAAGVLRQLRREDTSVAAAPDGLQEVEKARLNMVSRRRQLGGTEDADVFRAVETSKIAQRRLGWVNETARQIAFADVLVSVDLVFELKSTNAGVALTTVWNFVI